MNDKITISTFQLFAMFPDNETARKYLEGRLWPNGARCPVCSTSENITARKAGFYRCNACSEDFTVRTGTVMERSHVPLHKWLYAMYLLVTATTKPAETVISFPLAVGAINGWPTTVRLTAVEARATERAFLGGMEALRTADYRCACRTVDALMRKGIFGRDGLTPMGRAVGEALGRPE